MRTFRIKMVIEEFDETFGFTTIHETINTAIGVQKLKHYIISAKVWAENFMEKEIENGQV